MPSRQILVFALFQINICFAQSPENIRNQSDTFFSRYSSEHDFDRKLVPRAQLLEENVINDVVFRVYNGITANLGDVPYQIAFKARSNNDKYKTFCGGTLVGHYKIISAAHCFERKDIPWCSTDMRISNDRLRSIFAVAGHLYNVDTLKTTDSKTNGQWRKINYLLFPENYNFPNDDICMVFVYKPFVFNDYVKPVQHATVPKEYEGSCVVSGFGRVSDYQTSPRLLYAEIELLSLKTCERLHFRRMNKFICTSGSLADVGMGDSGGPLVCKNTGDPASPTGPILVGVTSGKRILRYQGSPYFHGGSFFTRVTSHISFLRSAGVRKIESTAVTCILIVINVLYLISFVSL